MIHSAGNQIKIPFVNVLGVDDVKESNGILRTSPGEHWHDKVERDIVCLASSGGLVRLVSFQG